MKRTVPEIMWVLNGRPVIADAYVHEYVQTLEEELKAARSRQGIPDPEGDETEEHY